MTEHHHLSRIDGRPAGWPLVSTIIPAYNAEAFIHKAINSALEQTHHPYEIIVVDDGSSDRTADVAARYPVTVIRQPNGGPASARNTGIKAASGEWIALLDHDDTWMPEKTAQQLALADDGVEAVFCQKTLPGPDICFENLYWRNHGGNPSSTIVRRDVALALGLFDDDRDMFGVDDYHFWLKFAYNGHRLATSPLLYHFTPAENHYGGKPDKMLAAEIVNIRKISAMARMDPATVSARMRALHLEYLPELIYYRRLDAARDSLRALGLDRAAMRYWHAFLPEWLLDARRRVKQRIFTPDETDLSLSGGG